MARPEEFSFQNSQDISVPRVSKGLRKVIRGDSGFSEDCLGTRFGYTIRYTRVQEQAVLRIHSAPRKPTEASTRPIWHLIKY